MWTGCAPSRNGFPRECLKLRTGLTPPWKRRELSTKSEPSRWTARAPTKRGGGCCALDSQGTNARLPPPAQDGSPTREGHARESAGAGRPPITRKARKRADQSRRAQLEAPRLPSRIGGFRRDKHAESRNGDHRRRAAHGRREWRHVARRRNDETNRAVGAERGPARPPTGPRRGLGLTGRQARRAYPGRRTPHAPAALRMLMTRARARQRQLTMGARVAENVEL